MRLCSVCLFVTGLFGPKIHPCCTMCQNSLPFQGWMLFHCMYTPWISFIHSLVACLYILVIVNNDAMSINIQVSLQYSIFSSFRYNPRRGTAGWYSNSTFNFVRNHHTVSHSSCIISHLGLPFFKEEFITSDIRRTPRTPEPPLPPDQIKALSFRLSFAEKEAAVLKYKSKLQWGLLVQEGSIEGHTLTFSCKNTKAAANCWATVDRRPV